MQRARRWRTVVKWGLLAGTVSVASVGGVSCWRWLSWVIPSAGTSWGIEVADAKVMVWSSGDPPNTLPPVGMSAEEPPRKFPFTILDVLAPNVARHSPSADLTVPLWSFFVPAFIGYTYLWRADAIAAKRAKVGKCPACGYDRAGLAPAAVCPECGKGAESNAAKG